MLYSTYLHMHVADNACIAFPLLVLLYVEQLQASVHFHYELEAYILQTLELVAR